MGLINYLILYVVLLVLVGTAYATDLATNNRVIQGSWYCPSTQDVFSRFDFNPDGTVMWLSYQPSKHSKHLWSPSFTEPRHYIFRSPTKIDVINDKIDVANNSTFLIESLTPDGFHFRWIVYGEETSYACTRTRPPGDTDDSRIKGATLINNQKKPFLGRWKTADGKEYIEFLSRNKCIMGFLRADRWKTVKDKFEVFYEGKTAICGQSPFTRETPDKIVLDHGMGGDPITYHRVRSSKNK